MRSKGWGWIVGVAIGLACSPQPDVPDVELEERAGAYPDVPDEIPADFPRYPDAELVSFDNTTFDQALTASFETSDSLAQIQAFYARELPASGWQLDVERRIDDRFIFYAGKGGLELNLEIFVAGPPRKIVMALYSPEPD